MLALAPTWFAHKAERLNGNVKPQSLRSQGGQPAAYKTFAIPNDMGTGVSTLLDSRLRQRPVRLGEKSIKRRRDHKLRSEERV